MVAVITWVWAWVYWNNSDGGRFAEAASSTIMVKPFVYRQLVPILARLLSYSGLHIDIAVILIMTAAGVGFYLALRQLAEIFYPLDERTEFILLASVPLCLLAFQEFRTIYDPMTGLLFTLGLLFIIQGERTKYLCLFPFICLNRETAFLLTLFYIAYNAGRMDKRFVIGVLYQAVVYLIIFIGARLYFADNSGDALWIEPLQNIQRFIADPLRTLLHVTVTAVVLWLATRDWRTKPAALLSAFIILMPMLMVMYLIFGQAFETRVFWEVSPVIILLALPTVRGYL